ncbi:MAG: rRNA methyltransferase [Bacilli bacterium]|nr:rRNA methyltransferase [Bacilli bacterium]
MSDHYFSSKPSASSARQLFRTELRGFALAFWTDSGVFSKRGIDFGSQLLIKVMDIPEDAQVLDMGCGYGPIGLTAAKLAHRGRVLLADVNERAVQLAQTNARQNAITNAEVIVSDLFESVGAADFTRILTNPPVRAGKAVVFSIFEEAVNRLRADGELWVVIQKKQGAPSAKKKLKELFAEVHDVERDAGYYIYRCRTPVAFMDS